MKAICYIVGSANPVNISAARLATSAILFASAAAIVLIAVDLYTVSLAMFAPILVAGFFALRSGVEHYTYRVSRLDERERELNRLAYARAYKTVTLLLSLLFAYAMLAAAWGRAWLPSEPDDWLVVGAALTTAVIVMPVVHVAWALRPAPGEE